MSGDWWWCLEKRNKSGTFICVGKTLLLRQFRHDLPNVDCTKELLFSITNC